MSTEEKSKSAELTRRSFLKASGAAVGGLAFGGAVFGPGAGKSSAAAVDCEGSCDWHDDQSPPESRKYTFFDNLEAITPWALDAQGNIVGEPLEEDEMRITFMGSVIPPVRRAQQEMSVFVEVGWDSSDPDNQHPVDQFVFDCGSGVTANYGAMGVGYGRMDKIFISHLHADHMSDLSQIYCFGPSGDRKSPLYVWGPGPSGVRSPWPPYRYYDDGTNAFCRHLREAMRWHSESFSFEATSWVDARDNLPTKRSWGLPVHPVAVGDDPRYDGYAMVPIQLNWRRYGRRHDDNVAYHNRATGVKITHFPVIHTRRGSIGYKLDWKGLSMIYTSDTRPERRSIEQAWNGGRGVDVFIHEMALPPEVWAMKNLGLSAIPSDGGEAWEEIVNDLTNVESCSHSPQGGFGYLLSRINPRPRLTVATHFPVADDTVACALNSVRAHVPDIAWDNGGFVYDPEHKNIVWSFDLMVISVYKRHPRDIRVRRAVVNDFGFSPVVKTRECNPPKYDDPRAQIDTRTEIPATRPNGKQNYCETGY